MAEVIVSAEYNGASELHVVFVDCSRLTEEDMVNVAGLPHLMLGLW